jgi:NADH-quinone oxidoreductase subunit N
MLEIFLALELISFPTYVLIALDKNKYATEASLKYFLFSVFGTLCFILSFIVLYISTGQVIPTFFAFYNSQSINMVSLLWAIAFFTKIGIGPFMQWVPAVYQSTSGPIFIFVAILTKVPLVLPIILISSWFFTVYNIEISVFIITILIITGSYFAAKSLFNENNIRKIFAYTGVINFTTATIAIIYSNDSKVFISFVYLYLISSLTTYIWHSIANTNKLGKEESTEIINLNRNKNFTNFIFSLIILFNSGLPPVTLFIFKLITTGAIVNFKINETQIITFFFLVIILAFAILSYYSYFRILLAVNHNTNNEHKKFDEILNLSVNQKYQFALEISVITFIYFILSLSYLIT